jgi:hypothetical protein
MRLGLLTIPLFLSASQLSAQAPCQLVGVWELVSGKANGKPYPAALHQVKIITRTRFAWVAREDNGLKDLKSVADSLKAYESRAGATGTYSVQGSTHTENIESFPEPAYEGRSIPFTCRVEGDRFYQTGNYPIVKDGKKVRDVMLEEVYRRIE